MKSPYIPLKFEKNKVDPESIHVDPILFSYHQDRTKFEKQKKEYHAQYHPQGHRFIDKLFIYVWLSFIAYMIIVYI